MTRFLRAFLRTGRNSDVWPVVLLLFAVTVPAVCLLWFMSAAMRNERLATHQKLADAYRGQLVSSQTRLEQYWKETTMELEKLAHTSPPSAAFARCVQSGLVDSVIVFDGSGRIAYPNAPVAPEMAPPEWEAKWAEANQLEYLRKDFAAAASRYDAVARESTNVNLAARARQAQARCLVQADQVQPAIRLVTEELGSGRYDRAVDPQGRLIAANAELMVLELLTNHATAVFQATAQRLRERLVDYENPVLAAPQRRFLMKEAQRLAATTFPMLGAEELAAGVARSADTFPAGTGESSAPSISPSSLPNVWQFTTADRRVWGLVRSEKLRAGLRPVIASGNVPTGAEIELLPPGADNATAFVSWSAGAPFPGWRLAFSLKDRRSLDTALAHRTGVYLWTGVLVLAVIGVLTLLAIRLLRRQTALARLKNDLAATISHELKTPLSSMRVLVDTLLESDQIEERTAREYLQLIAQENERLSRLIQNFLTFSRMERRKCAFHFASVSPRQVMDAAVESVRERFRAPGCHFEMRLEGDLPAIAADPDALSTALINLLDNAHKYSEDIKHISLRARAENGNVLFSVRDNGIGIAPREVKKIFHPFHQVDQPLSRKGSGCGLGLSIVQFIVSAHDGNVSVESEPGRGSTFTISIPVRPAAATVRQEAIA